MIFVLLCNVFCFVYLSQLFVDVKCPFFWYFLLSCLPSAFMHSLVHSLIHSSMHTSVHLLLFPVILLTVWHQRIPWCFGINYVDINLKFSIRLHMLLFMKHLVISSKICFRRSFKQTVKLPRHRLDNNWFQPPLACDCCRGFPEWFGLHTKSTL